MALLSAAEFALTFDPPVSKRWVLAMCKRGQIRGAVKVGTQWVIPEGAMVYRDERYVWWPDVLDGGKGGAL